MDYAVETRIKHCFTSLCACYILVSRLTPSERIQLRFVWGEKTASVAVFSFGGTEAV